MFEYEFYNRAGDDGCTPRVTSRRPEGFITLNQVESMRPTFWGEHCVECSMPLCFGTCARYEARADGKCRRFKFGIKNNDDPAFADFPYHAEIAFKPWGKLESVLYPGTASVGAVLEQNKRYLAAALEVASALNDHPDTVEASEFGRLFDQGYSNADDIISDDDLGAETNHFVFQLYSYEDKAFELSFEITSLQRLVHREMFSVQPGFNEFMVPLRISTPLFRKLALSKDVLLARLVPQNDYEAHIVVLMAEFVNFVQGRPSAGGAESESKLLQASIPLNPAEKVKCVCWDLDNTVWDGTLIESEPDELELRPGVRQVMDELDHRGIVQVVVSKNQEEDALPVLKRLGIDELFVYTFINWNPKSDNIAKAADALNINVDTFAFIDDQPYERAEVGEALPCVRVYKETDIAALLDSPPFDVPVTTDAANRRIMYQTEAKRRSIEQGFDGSNIDFIRSCDLEVEISLPDTEAKRVRSYELVQRTNQLNLSGRRYRAEEFAALMDGAEGQRVVCVTCQDRFGQYGQVGYAMLELFGATLYVREFAMSCRVMGKCVENALAAWLAGLARSVGADCVVFKGRKTKRNGLLVKTLLSVGFCDEAIFDEDIVLMLHADAIVEHADAVRVVDKVHDMLTASCLVDADARFRTPTEALFFVPHQDDEVLTCGAGIVDALHVFNGRVGVVLCTDGKNCETRLFLNDGGRCADLHDEHRFDFGCEEYGFLRDVEFADSCENLGVPKRAIRIAEARMVDGELEVEGSRHIIEEFLRAYPDALVATHAHIEPLYDARVDDVSLEVGCELEHLVDAPDGGHAWAPQHRDHRRLAQAALELFEQGRIGTVELFVEFYHVAQFRVVHPDVSLMRHMLTAEGADRLCRAIDAYGVWDPAHQRYALGLHSARAELEYMRRWLGGYSYFPLRDESGEERARAAEAALAVRTSQCSGFEEEAAFLRTHLAVVQNEYDALKESSTYRVGHAIMALPCALKDKVRKEDKG